MYSKLIVFLVSASLLLGPASAITKTSTTTADKNTVVMNAPSLRGTENPTEAPTESPTEAPTTAPTSAPTSAPSIAPTTSHATIIRKEIGTLTDEEWDAFADAVLTLQSKGIWQTYNDVHSAVFFAVHNKQQFWPWHREFLRAMEQELRNAAPANNRHLVALNYWNWSKQANSNVDSPVFQRYGGFNYNSASGCITDGPFAKFDTKQSACIRRGTSFRGHTPDQTTVRAALASSTFRQATWRFEGFHNSIHNAMGGTMRSMDSPIDPLFYAHHTYVDLQWLEWQNENVQNQNDYDGNSEDFVAWFSNRPKNVKGNSETVMADDTEFANRRIRDTFTHESVTFAGRRLDGTHPAFESNLDAKARQVLGNIADMVDATVASSRALTDNSVHSNVVFVRESCRHEDGCTTKEEFNKMVESVKGDYCEIPRLCPPPRHISDTQSMWFSQSEEQMVQCEEHRYFVATKLFAAASDDDKVVDTNGCVPSWVFEDFVNRNA
jgi:hypothetical protein